MKISTTVTRRGRVFNKGSQVRQKLEEALENKVKPAAIQRSKARVSSWSHKPQIFARKNYTTMRMALHVHPGGRYRNLWEWTSRGTRAHPITARNAPTLRFQENYSARTRPGNLFNVGTGRSSGPWRAPVSVSHPGTAPRHFEEYIAEEMQPIFNDAIREALVDAYAQ